MTECNSEKILDNMLYEADVAYIGSRSKRSGQTSITISTAYTMVQEDRYATVFWKTGIQIQL